MKNIVLQIVKKIIPIGSTVSNRDFTITRKNTKDSLSYTDTEKNSELEFCFDKFEDILDKTFNTIFYIPHFNPFQFKELFKNKLSLIIDDWFESLYEFINIKHSEIIKKFSEDRLNEINKSLILLKKDTRAKEYILKCCWNIFIDRKDYSALSARKILSYLRQIYLLLNINFTYLLFNLFVYDKSEVNRIILYVAFYSNNISLFRQESLASFFNLVGESWKNPSYGLFQTNNKRYFIDNHGELLFSVFMESIYYQNASKSDSGGNLYFQTLVDAINHDNSFLVELKLNNAYFYDNSAEVMDNLLEQVKSFDLIISILDKVESKQIDIFKYSELGAEAKRDIWSKVWKNIYFSVLICMAKHAFSGIIESDESYSLVKKIFLKYFPDNKKALFILILYIKYLIVCHLQQESTKNAVWSGLVYIKELSIINNEVTKYSLSVCDFSFDSFLDNTLDPDLSLLSFLVSNSEQVALNYKQANGSFIIKFSNSLEAVLLLDVISINAFIRTVIEDNELYTFFYSLNCNVFLKYGYNQDSSLHVAVNWMIPVSFKSRNFILNHIKYNYEQKINLKNIFIESFAHKTSKEFTSFEKKPNTQLPPILRYQIIRYIYKYVLLTSNYKKLTFDDKDFSFDDICVKFKISKLIDISEKYSSIPNIFRFLISLPLDSLTVLKLYKNDIDELKKSQVSSDITKFDSIEESFDELNLSLSALVMVQDFILNKSKEDISLSHDYSDESYKFFINCYLGNDQKLIGQCYDYLEKTL